MMSARLLRPARERRHSRLGAWSAGRFDAMVASYGRMLHWVLDRPRATMAVFGLTLALTAALYVVVPKGFFPLAGHRPDPGHHRGHADHLVRRYGPPPAGPGRG